MGCGGNCGSCGGCARELLLTEAEIQALEQLAAYAFLPVARRAGTMEPPCWEEGLPQNCGPALAHLERKGLVRLDYDRPLGNFDYGAYEGFPVHGSAALTQRGQQVVELLEIQGVCVE